MLPVAAVAPRKGFVVVAVAPRKGFVVVGAFALWVWGSDKNHRTSLRRLPGFDNLDKS